MFLLELMGSYHVICSRIIKRNRLHCCRFTLTGYMQGPVLHLSFYGDTIPCRVEIVFKALMCGAACPIVAVGVSERERSSGRERGAVPWSPRNTPQGGCSILASHFTVMFMLNSLFLTTREKKAQVMFSKEKNSHLFDNLSTDLPTKKQQLQALNLLVLLLPDVNRDTLKVSWTPFPCRALRAAVCGKTIRCCHGNTSRSP